MKITFLSVLRALHSEINRTNKFVSTVKLWNGQENPVTDVQINFIDIAEFSSKLN